MRSPRCCIREQVASHKPPPWLCCGVGGRPVREHKRAAVFGPPRIPRAGNYDPLGRTSSPARTDEEQQRVEGAP
ncbi:hypothetical protein MTO96_018450 [Rhipicephalus appendiculatus]